MATNTYKVNTSKDVTTREGQHSLLIKSFLYMFVFLLITVGVCVGSHFLFQSLGFTTGSNAYMITLITCSVLQIVLTIIIAFSALKSGKGVVVWFTLYSICMGFLLTSFTFVLDWYTLGSAFLISALTFGSMALFGAISKNATGFAFMAFGFLIAALLASIFNIVMFFVNRSSFNVINVVVNVLMILAICCITAFDVHNIKKISEAGVNCPNLALYFAFNLYLDFIIILIRILTLIASLSNKN